MEARLIRNPKSLRIISSSAPGSIPACPCFAINREMPRVPLSPLRSKKPESDRSTGNITALEGNRLVRRVRISELKRLTDQALIRFGHSRYGGSGGRREGGGGDGLQCGGRSYHLRIDFVVDGKSAFTLQENPHRFPLISKLPLSLPLYLSLTFSSPIIYPDSFFS